jgi:hypothetical protein
MADVRPSVAGSYGGGEITIQPVMLGLTLVGTLSSHCSMKTMLLSGLKLQYKNQHILHEAQVHWRYRVC